MQTHKSFVGVMIREDSVSVIQFGRRRRGWYVQGFAQCPLREGVVQDGTISDLPTVRATVDQACRDATPHPIKPSAPAVVALPERKTFLRVMMVPHAAESQLSTTVQFEMENHIPLPPEEVYYDFQRIPALDTKTDIAVVLLAASRQTVDTYRAACASLRIVGVEADSTADARAICDKRKTQLLIMCGITQTRLTAVVSGIPVFSVSIPVGISTMQADVVRALGVTPEEANTLFTHQGIGSYIDRDPLFMALQPSLQSLADALRKSSAFCAKLTSQEMTTAVLYGKMALWRGLRAKLVAETGMRIAVADPWKCVHRQSSEIPVLNRSTALDNMTVIGCALRSYEDLA